MSLKVLSHALMDTFLDWVPSSVFSMSATVLQARVIIVAASMRATVKSAGAGPSFFWYGAASAATGPAESLQRESGEDGFTLELVLGDYGAEERMVEHVALRAVIEKLPEKERQVVALRFYHGMTQQSCARVMHVSQVQISRLERRAVERLRELLS